MKIYNEVVAIIAKELEVSVDIISDDTAIGDIESWDSLHQIAIISALEGHYGFQFEPETIMDMEDVGDIVAAVEKRV